MVWAMPRQHPNIVLVHFFGDSTIASELIHGNSKKPNGRPYHRTLPSTVREMRDSALEPAAFYRQKRAEVGPDPASQVLFKSLSFYLAIIKYCEICQMFAAPRNTVQVRNAQKNARRRNGQTDTLSMLQIYAHDHNDTRYIIALHCFGVSG